MTIAVNTRIVSGDTRAGKFLLDSFFIIATENPAHQFVFISENDLSTIPSPANVKKVVIKQQSGSSLMWKLWYNYKLSAALRKSGADVLVTADGVCSLRTRVPQCLLVSDLDFLDHPEWYDKKYLRFMRSNFTASLQKAMAVITSSAHIKDELIGRYKIDELKISVVYPGIHNNSHPVDSGTKEAVKEKYTGGKEYFLFNGELHSRSNLVNLLKAFSIFKRRQKSNMHLVIATENIPGKNAFVESLRLYKYRSELKLLAGLDEKELLDVNAAAYCSVNLSPLSTDINLLQNALSFEVPVIAGSSPAAKEILGEAALYAVPDSVEMIAEQLMLLYKDENRRNAMIKKGIEQALKYAATKTYRERWLKVLAAAGQ